MQNIKPINHRFPRYLCCVLVLAHLSVIPAGRAFSDEGRLLTPGEQSAFFERLRGVQKDIKTLRAQFTEQRKIAAVKTPLSFSGQLYYSRDDLFFMSYEVPIQYTLHVKGREATLYVDGSPTADVVNISDMKGLAGPSNLFSWNPDGFTGKVWEDRDGYRIAERSKNTATHEQGMTLQLLLDKQTLLVKTIRIEDPSGDITEIALSAIEIDVDLPARVREFNLPEGIKLNRLNQQ